MKKLSVVSIIISSVLFYSISIASVERRHGHPPHHQPSMPVDESAYQAFKQWAQNILKNRKPTDTELRQAFNKWRQSSAE